MARQKSDNFDQVKAGIIDAAAIVFADKGFRNANIIEIGNACKASKSRLYHYFPSKEAMLFEMLQAHVSGLVEIASGVYQTKKPISERFDDYIGVHVDYYLRHAAKHSVLLHDIDYLPVSQQKMVAEGKKRLLNMMVELLQEINPSRFKDIPVATAHAMLIYGMLNWTYTWYDPKGPVSADQLGTYVTELCLKGIL